MRTAIAFLSVLLFAAGASAQTITMYPPQAVGSGLQSDGFGVVLSESQHGGIFVTLASSDSTLALVAGDEVSVGAPSASNFVPNGTTYLEFVVQGLENVTGTVTLTISAPGFTDQQADVDIDTPRFRVVGIDTSLDVPDPDNAFYVQLGRPNAGGIWQALEYMRVGGPGATVDVSLSNPAAAELTTTALNGQTVAVSLFGGQGTTPHYVASGGVALVALAAGATDVTVSIPGFAGEDGGVVAVDVGAAELSLAGLPTTVGAGLRVRNGSLAVALNGSAHGGTTVNLVSLDSSLVLLAVGPYDLGQGSVSIFVPDGDIYATFYTHGLEGGTGIGLVEATAPGWVSVTDGVEIVTPGLEIRNLVTAIDTLDPVDPFTVQVGVPDPTAAGLTEPQPVRPGSAGLDVALISDDPAIGQFETSMDYGDTVWVRIDSGVWASPSTVGTGGIAFDGVGPGAVLVHAESPGHVTTTAGLHTVTVSQPGMTIYIPSGVGGGLEAQDCIVILNANSHGGVMVHLELDDPALALVSGARDSVGTVAVDVFVPDGQAAGFFHLQGLENVLGTVGLAASAPGFTAAATTFEVVVPAIEILPLTQYQSSLLTPQSEIDYPDPFQARIGAASGANSVAYQVLRPGSAGIDVTATVDDPLVGRLLTAADSSATVTVRIEAMEYSTATSVATGGFAFDGIDEGPVNVTVSSPGFDQQGWATRPVTVLPATIAVTNSSDAGAGLVSTANRILLNGYDHGGTAVHLEVSDPALALLSPYGGVVDGQTGIDLFIPDGEAGQLFDLHGLDLVTGTLTVTGTAPGFVTGQNDWDVVTPSVELQNVITALDVNDPLNHIRARVGLPDPGNNYVQVPQTRRPGVPPLTATVASADSGVVEVLTLAGSAGSRQVEIAAGLSTSPVSVTAGGVAQRGVGPGVTLVSVQIPGFFQVGTAIHEVTVTQNGVALLGIPAALGAGLQSPPLVARFNTSAHGGTTLRLTTSDAASALVSGNATLAGSDTIDVFVPNGQQETVFHLQALEGATGPLTVTALVGETVSGVRSLDLVTPAVVVSQLADSLNVLDPDDAFIVEVGVPSADLAELAVTQVVRAGASPLACPLVLDVGAPADLVTLAATADSVDVVIQPGQSQSALSVGAGGIALHPVAGGLVTVSARPTGFVLTAGASRPVFVIDDVSGVGDVPLVLALQGNHPNPFNPSTRIDFSLARSGRVRLDVFDVRGRLVRNLVADELGAGPHTAVWNGADDSGRAQATGVYLVRLRTDDGVKAHKMALMK